MAVVLRKVTVEGTELIFVDFHPEQTNELNLHQRVCRSETDFEALCWIFHERDPTLPVIRNHPELHGSAAGCPVKGCEWSG